MNKKFIFWHKDDDLLEVIRLLIPYMSYADIGRLLGKNRRTIHYVVKTYGLDREKTSNTKMPLPLIIIKNRDKYDEDLLTLKDFKNDS